MEDEPSEFLEEKLMDDSEALLGEELIELEEN